MISLSQAVTWDDYIEDRWLRDASEKGWGYFRTGAWATEKSVLDDVLPEMRKILFRSDVGSDAYLEDGVVSSLVSIKRDGKVYVHLAGDSQEGVDNFYDRLRKIIGGIKDEEGVAPVEFWYKRTGGQTSKIRKISVLPWDEILSNYSSTTRDKLSGIMRDFRPAYGGQLLLWHGSPGTGKTYALRALIKEWQKWCRFEYIVDPENFFSSEPSYLMNVLINPREEEWRYDDAEPEDDRWRLLIFEDTGELMTENARERSGQGLSRLLNTVDGLIGQGLKVLVLITTNEEIHTLHPAVSRPGRSAHSILFTELTAEEATDWAEQNSVILPSHKTYDLADLYAIKHGMPPRPAKPPRLGFGAIDKQAEAVLQ